MGIYNITFCILLISIVAINAQHKTIKSPRILRQRAPRQGSSYINIPDPQATTVKISFGYVNGARSFKIYAKEWIDGKYEQTVPTDNATKAVHDRSAILKNLLPGREYLIQVQAYDKNKRPIGTISEIVVRTSQRCYECNSVGSNGQCIGEINKVECAHNLDGCLNELRYANGKPSLTKRCAQFRRELSRTVQNGRNILTACSGLEVRRDAFCKCMCKSDLCNEAEMPCVDECFNELPVPSGMKLTCSNNNKIGSVCTWECASIGTIEGLDQSKCRTDRTWSLLSPPRCVGAPKVKDEDFKCPRLDPIEPALIECTDEYNVGSVCTFSCTGDYKLTGSTTRQCQRSGKWTGTEAICGEIRCPEIRRNPNLAFECTNRNNVGSVCEFMCGSSLKVFGAPTINCLKTGRWSDETPTCVQPDCAIPPDTNPNVLMECSKMIKRKGRTCEFSCEAGYRREGATRSTCYRGNSWTQKSPFCKKIQCQPGMTPPSAGFVRCDGKNYYGSTCTFTCKSGFNIIGASSSTCQADGTWSTRKPICKEIACPRISRFSFGSLVCNRGVSFGSSCSISCITGYGLPLESPSRITCTKKDPRIEYHPSQSTPRDTGAWSHPVPNCERIECPDLGPDPKHSIVKCNKVERRVLGVTCNYACIPGYNRIGLSRLSCLRNSDGSSIGKWTGKPPSCQRVVCPVVPTIDNGAAECTEENLSGSQCTITCKRGYRLSANSQPTCTDNGYWSTRFPICTRVECLRKPFIMNGFFDCGRAAKLFTDSVCIANCQAGYQLQKEGGATCNEAGEWVIPDKTVCQDVDECLLNLHDCDQLCDNTVGSFLCSCREGFVLMEDRKNCKPAVCSPLQKMNFGKISCTDDWAIGTICTLSCKSGYEPSGVASTVCLEGGKWKRELDECVRIQCPVIEAPNNGAMDCSLSNMFASVCDFSCVEGYKLIGTDTVRCEADERWSHDVPTCRKIECPISHVQLINGLAICSEFNRFQSSCRYSCNIGYKFADDTAAGDLTVFMAECLQSGLWDQPKPKCVRKSCDPTVEFIRSQRPNSLIKCTDGELFGSTCTIQCNDGYEVEGAFRISCAGDAEWSREIGTCEKVSCPAFKPMSHGNIECTDGYRYQSTCNFECLEGYKLIGNPDSECQDDRTWTNKRPICERRTCDTTHLTLSFGTADCTDGLYYSSVCSFKCDPGYEFIRTSPVAGVTSKKNRIGTREIETNLVTAECLEIGWSREKPACTKHQCMPPNQKLARERPNSFLQCTDGDFYQSKCELACMKGYEIQRGSDEITCTDDRTWSPSLGYCDRINCAPFKTLVNGAITCTNGYKFQSRCDFSCDPGYEIEGESKSFCLANRSMSSKAPTCEKITCPITHTKLTNGNATCSDGNRYLSKCLYFCDPGYEMEFTGDVVRHEEYGNMAVLTCQADRTWGGKLPFCRRKKCSLQDGGIIRAKLNGDVFCSESFWFGSVCAVQCHRGYQLKGPASTRCNANAGWSPAIGYCIKRECNMLHAPSNGSMECTDGFKFESVCSFECDFGFEMRGWDKTECTADEYFTNAPPFCREIFCPKDYLNLSNGKVTCSNKNKLASRCEYECIDGWELTPTSVSVATCEDTYKWDALAKPQCQRKVCPATDPMLLKAQVNGAVTCTSKNLFESLCTVVCNDGYELVEGSKITRCQEDETWGPLLGHCIKINCPELVPLVNGNIECTDGTRYQSECSFSCEAGYDKVGSDFTVCQADRTYSHKSPTCIKIKCPASYLEILNGKVSCTEENYFGSVCEYTCANGYERITGSTTVQCLSDRTWNSDKAKCSKKVCDKSHKMLTKADEHGTITCSEEYFFQSVCKLTCDTGYELAPSSTSVGRTRCNSDGEWNDDIGYCIKIQCPLLTAPVNGTMKCTEENRYQSECQFTCDEGFEMEGLALTECQYNKKWTVSAPKCTKIQCPTSHLSISNGNTECSDRNRFLSLCKYECDAGYEFQEGDASQSKCMSTRAWSHPLPTCSKKFCNPEDPMLEKARINGVVHCTDGARFESECNLLCYNGWQLANGEGLTTCGPVSKWEGQIGYCERITCDALTEPDNSNMACSNQFKFESICSFECDNGYEMSGFDSSTCLENGTFSNKEPTCNKIQCSIDYLRLPFGVANCTENNLFQSVCTYSCQRGYRMVGGGITGTDVRYISSTCKHDRSWSVEIPMCEKKTCPYDSDELQRAREHGNLVCTEGNRYQSRCSLICNEGYELSGTGTITCTDTGAWNQPIGYCIKKRCPEYNVPPHTDIQCSDGTFYNSTCTLACNVGYRFEEEELARINMLETRCSKDALWTMPEPDPCIDDECDASFTRLNNGNVTCTDGVRYLSQCHFQCDAGYQLVEKYDEYDLTSVIITCGSNGSWTTQRKPICERLTCDPNMQYLDQTMEHGEIKCTLGSKFESECVLTCNHGYEVNNGISETRCTQSGSWEPELGICQKISCPPLAPNINSRLECSDKYLFKSSCRVLCDMGYQIHDPEGDYSIEDGIECKADGTWCGDPPPCTRIRCPINFLELEGGMVECSNENLYESVCQYSCSPGYQMTQGQVAESTCTAHEVWSNPLPTCEKRRCPANDSSIKEAQRNGEVLCSDENRYDSTCQLHCYNGYELSGEPSTTCRHDGEWSNGIGLCNKINCPVLRSTFSSIMTCSDEFRFESNCDFTCKPGFKETDESMKDGSNFFCQADKTWSGHEIECEKITCPRKGFDNLKNGAVTCNDTNLYLSQCLFECEGGYEMTIKVDEDPASVLANCTETGTWDILVPPTCQRVYCDVTVAEINQGIDNGRVECSSNNQFESECELVCDSGYEPSDGFTFTICGSDKMWSPPLTRCKKITCGEPILPENAFVTCTDEHYYGSTCKIDCPDGFDVVNTPQQTKNLVCTSSKQWRGTPATCKKRQCEKKQLTIINGASLCTDDNNYGSECEVTCSKGFELMYVGQEVTRCTETGIWNATEIECKPKTCKTTFSRFGSLVCSGSNLNAVCVLTCNRGYELNGPSRSACTDGGFDRPAVWQPAIGECEKIRCPQIRKDTHGYFKCHDENRFRSVCQHYCDAGYKLPSVTDYNPITCLADRNWSRQVPKCQPLVCDPSYLDYDYGTLVASNSNLYNSILKFDCPEVGHVWSGVKIMRCVGDGLWSEPKPHCERNTCKPLTLPNGRVECNGKRHNDYDSTCSFMCDDLHELIGESETICQLDGTWTNPVPFCKPHCDIKFDNFTYGGVECSNSHYHHSRCNFWCDPDNTGFSDNTYRLYGDSFLTCTETGKWSGTPPCCAKTCPPHAKMDLFLIFDSSSSVGYQNWRKLLSFANQVISNFNIGTDGTLVGAFRFNRDVDTRSEIPIGKYVDVESLSRAIKYLPYGGWGTYTGEALEHVVKYSIKHPNNRPDAMDVVILFTDGMSQDSIAGPANLLHERNITTHVVGIENHLGVLNLHQLSQIASKPQVKHTTIVREGFDHLTKDFSIKLGKAVCENPCRLDQNYRARTAQYFTYDESEKVDVVEEIKRKSTI